MRLYLVRHAQTAWNAEMKAQGHMDVELDTIGREQAQKLAAAFANSRLDLVLCSDLKRARETAEPIARATRAKLESRVDLRERSFGEWEGMAFDEIARRFRESEATGLAWHEVVPPGGESFLHVWKRLQGIVGELFTTRKQIAIVTHGGTCALLLAHLLKGTVETSRGFRFKNTGLTELIRRPEGQFQLLRYNDLAHLDSHKPPLGGNADGSMG